ncbi:mannosyltransferase, putative, partial [Trypanosoma cruzi marinkellei]
MREGSAASYTLKSLTQSAYALHSTCQQLIHSFPSLSPSISLFLCVCACVKLFCTCDIYHFLYDMSTSFLFILSFFCCWNAKKKKKK